MCSLRRARNGNRNCACDTSPVWQCRLLTYLPVKKPLKSTYQVLSVYSFYYYAPWPSLGSRIKRCATSVCPSVCLSICPVPPIFSKQASHKNF